MSTLVLIELNSDQVSANTRAAVTAAKLLSNKVDALILTNNSNYAKSVSSIDGIDTVKLITDDSLEHVSSEVASKLVSDVMDGYQYLVAGSSTFSKNILPRVGALLDVQPISDVCEIKSSNTFVRPLYAGNIMATVESIDPTIILTVRSTSFEHAPDGGSAPIEQLTVDIPKSNSSFVEIQESKSERPELTTAERIVSGGRGLGSKENFELIEKLADKLSAAVGASRAAVDAGFISNDYQVGQTGKVVAPKIYIAVGISGAIQHLAGMKDSQVIVAINNDPDAPMCRMADLVWQVDLFEAIDDMLKH
ncbi:MAG TPA: electron transfer flavoprotein subunit alpha/FixB family protein [Candidatus Thioglobus sp.]|jgi:electron transfer flavoprotein alpha subunit|nr:electron transfer flavoprotein subunit alpha/FixB family protein [Candidatus Thioglobus sp.]HIL42727.1 electron transfer flavoprotein subunit alpha/FixB family protein [Gammaproteobacteria bacterium]